FMFIGDGDPTRVGHAFRVPLFCPGAAMSARTALLVDDDPATADSVRGLIPGGEVKLEATADASEAIDCLRKHHYCGLVLDLESKGGHALDLLRFMSSAHIGIPIVLITSKFPDSLRRMAVVEDIKLTLKRPVDGSLLVAMILGLCGIEL